ncbi:helix-turn-helix domain-containing protein [Streptomyces rubiginosohelvolus]|uniref:helix-turn-helix domain-containing protein n=1 Tax=Streptomyces rubiginosohelvolus TaxID=67362 RepID=UPI0035E1C128
MLPMLWAMKSAPVVDAEERSILMALAESAWADGTDAFPSKKTIAQIAVVDPKTVQRRLRTLTARGLIAEGATRRPPRTSLRSTAPGSTTC